MAVAMGAYQESNDRSMRLQQDGPGEQTVRRRSSVKVYYHVALDGRVDLARWSCRNTHFSAWSKYVEVTEVELGGMNAKDIYFGRWNRCPGYSVRVDRGAWVAAAIRDYGVYPRVASGWQGCQWAKSGLSESN